MVDRSPINMCLTAPTSTFYFLAEDKATPEDLQQWAAAFIQQVDLQNAAVARAKSPENMPSTGHTDFTCTLYSLNNKTFPELMAEQEKVDVKAVIKDINDGKRNTAAIMDLPGELIQKGSQIFPTKNVGQNADGSYPEDKIRQHIYDSFRTVWTFYKTCFNRNSLDDQGLEMRATIHIAKGFGNAMWESDSQAMYFGDGGRPDGRGWLVEPEMTEEEKKRDPAKKALQELLNFQLTNWHAVQSIDVIAHELTHGVVSFTAKLGSEQLAKKAMIKYKEAKTLNEHIADCFGIMTKHFSNKHTAEQGNWDMCPNFWSQQAIDSKIHPSFQPWKESYMRTFRIPANPAASPDAGPKHMKDMPPFDEDTDPHANVGIPNHAFYRAALEFCKDSHEPTWENIGQIWYNALTDAAFKVAANQTFKGWRDLTIQHADKLLKDNGKGKTIMTNAWQAVGL